MSWRVKPDGELIYQNSIKGFLAVDEKFQMFKTPSVYTLIIGAPSAIQATQMFHKMPDTLKQKLDVFKKADSIGSPHMLTFTSQSLSPNLIRQLDSMRLLEENFGSLDGWTIQEIGAGWGGLAYCISSYWKPENYYVVDLEEAFELAKKHDALLGVELKKGPCPSNVDLAIAEYSITEHNGESLDQLVNDYLMTADRIFVRCNFFQSKDTDAFILKLRERFDIQLSQEVGNTVRFNSVIVGKLPDV